MALEGPSWSGKVVGDRNKWETMVYIYLPTAASHGCVGNSPLPAVFPWEGPFGLGVAPPLTFFRGTQADGEEVSPCNVGLVCFAVADEGEPSADEG